MNINELKDYTYVGPIAAFKEYFTGKNPEIVSTLPGDHLLKMQGRDSVQYWALNIPRNSKFETAEDVSRSSVTGTLMRAKKEDMPSQVDIIVTRHKASMEWFRLAHPLAKAFNGEVSEQDVTGKHVLGVLPPHLITKVASMQSLTIKDFDYVKDNDIELTQELLQRFQCSDPFSLEEVK